MSATLRMIVYSNGELQRRGNIVFGGKVSQRKLQGCTDAMNRRWPGYNFRPMCVVRLKESRP